MRRPFSLALCSLAALMATATGQEPSPMTVQLDVHPPSRMRAFECTRDGH